MEKEPTGEASVASGKELMSPRDQTMNELVGGLFEPERKILTLEEDSVIELPEHMLENNKPEPQESSPSDIESNEQKEQMSTEDKDRIFKEVGDIALGSEIAEITTENLSFSGGIDTLKSMENCTNFDEAFGNKWAEELISGFENYKKFFGQNEKFAVKEAEMHEKIGGFAKAVEYLAKKEKEVNGDENADADKNFITFAVDSAPCDELVAALKMSGMSTDESGEYDGFFEIVLPQNTAIHERHGMVVADLNPLLHKDDGLFDESGNQKRKLMWPTD